MNENNRFRKLKKNINPLYVLAGTYIFYFGTEIGGLHEYLDTNRYTDNIGIHHTIEDNDRLRGYDTHIMRYEHGNSFVEKRFVNNKDLDGIFISGNIENLSYEYLEEFNSESNIKPHDYVKIEGKFDGIRYPHLPIYVDRIHGTAFRLGYSPGSKTASVSLNGILDNLHEVNTPKKQ